MIVILNELSMDGQFTEEGFLSTLPGIIKSFKAFNSLKFQISKNSLFFQSNVSPTVGLREFIVGNRDERVIKFKSTLIPLTDDEPFWDLNPRHNCNDKYVSDYTDKLCNYGIAEAVETNKVVFSFEHATFSDTPLSIKKNEVKKEVFNVIDNSSLISFLFETDRFDFVNIVKEDIPKAEYFPNKDLSNNLFDAKNIEENFANLSTHERVATFKRLGKHISLVNCWKICDATTNLNDRDIYKRSYQSGFHYLSIDTQHGRFELFDASGLHIGEYYMYGELVLESRSNRHITI